MAGENNIIKVDKATQAVRVRTVMEWLIKGHITRDILQQCESKWGVTSRMGYKYIRWAYKEFAKISDEDIINLRAQHIVARWKLYNELENKQTAAGAMAALAILDRIAKIQGVLVDRVDITSKGKELKAQTTEPVVFKTTLKIA